MAITKVAAPTAMAVNWNPDGTLSGVSVTYLATFTDSTTGTVATITKGPKDVTPANGSSFANTLAAIYAAFPSSGL